MADEGNDPRRGTRVRPITDTLPKPMDDGRERREWNEDQEILTDVLKPEVSPP